MIQYNENKKSIPLDINLDYHLDSRFKEKLEMVEKAEKELGKWIHETKELWLDKQLQIFFSYDFDLLWAYDTYKYNKDWNGLKRMIEDHDLRIVEQYGKVANGSWLTYLYHNSSVLGTLEIKVNDNFEWKVIYS